jgi:hypothetical protein
VDQLRNKQKPKAPSRKKKSQANQSNEQELIILSETVSEASQEIN